MHKAQETRRLQLVRVSEAARILDTSVRYVWKLLAEGRLTPIRLGGRRATRVDIAELERLVQAARESATR